MTSHTSSLRRSGAGLLVAAAFAFASTALPAMAQDMRGLLGALGGSQTSGASGGAAGLVNGLLGGSAPAAAAAPNRVGQATEIVQLLGQSLEQIDQPKEIDIGRQMAAVLLGSKPLSPDLALQAYVNRLGRWIALQSARPDLPWTFAVLDDNGFNAFAAPGGYVFVTRGLVERVGSEAELAGILSHEITHVTQRHHLQALRKSAQTGLLTQLVSTQLNDNLRGAVSSQLIALGRNLYTKGLDQDDEFEADRIGVALATRAGFDPYGLPAVLQLLRTEAPSDPVFALSLSTHPAPQARLDRLGDAMAHRLDGFTGMPPVAIASRLVVAAAPAAPTKSAPAPRKKKG